MMLEKEVFYDKIIDLGFKYQECEAGNSEFYIKNSGIYQIQIDRWSDCCRIILRCNSQDIFTTTTLTYSSQTLSVVKNLLIGFDNNNDNENNYTITFNVEDMIKEAEFCGYKINEEQAVKLIDYLYRKADGVYETIQQYITGYCATNKFEKLKED